MVVRKGYIFLKMANTKAKIKAGMGGSSSGKNRWDKIEELKRETKKRRRLEGKNEVDESQVT